VRSKDDGVLGRKYGKRVTGEGENIVRKGEGVASIVREEKGREKKVQLEV